MKLVIVNENNRDKIESALEEAQKKCRSYIIYFSDIVKTIEEIETRLKEIGLKKKMWQGLIFYYEPKFVLPQSYKHIGSCKATNYTLWFKKGKWRIDVESICRYSAGTQYGSCRDGEIIFTEEQKKEVIRIQMEKITTI